MWKSLPDRYGRMAILIHWTSALLIIALMIAGFIIANTADPEIKASVLRIHAPVGMGVLLLTVMRIGWWLFADRKPREMAGIPRLQAIAAQAVHGLLYLAIVGLVGSGVAMFAMSGAGDILFGTAPGPLPDFWAFTPRLGHAIFARFMGILLLAHVGAALYHQFVRKDRLFARMGLGKSGLGKSGIGK